MLSIGEAAASYVTPNYDSIGQSINERCRYHSPSVYLPATQGNRGVIRSGTD